MNEVPELVMWDNPKPRCNHEDAEDCIVRGKKAKCCKKCPVWWFVE